MIWVLKERRIKCDECGVDGCDMGAVEYHPFKYQFINWSKTVPVSFTSAKEVRADAHIKFDWIRKKGKDYCPGCALKLFGINPPADSHNGSQQIKLEE